MILMTSILERRFLYELEKLGLRNIYAWVMVSGLMMGMHESRRVIENSLILTSREDFGHLRGKQPQSQF